MPADQAKALKNLLTTDGGELCGLHDVGTTRSWDYSLPTIGCHRGFTDRHNFASDSSFLEIFQKKVNKGVPYEILQNAGAFEQNNSVVLFGGCILDIIFKRHDSIKDFDLRLVGEAYLNDEAKCLSKAKEFVASIFSYLSKENDKLDERKRLATEGGRGFYESKYDLQEVTVSRCRSTVTVYIPQCGTKKEMIFQLTFAPTRSVKDMLTACQPHCTRLAIKDCRVVLDQMARFCIESTCVVLDPPAFVNYYLDGEGKKVDGKSKEMANSGRTMASQLARFIKYYEEKGFDIILPDLDIEKAPKRNLKYGVNEVLALPSMIVVYDKIKGNIIMATSLSLPKKLKAKDPGNVPIGEYDSSPKGGVGEVIHHNIRCLVHGVYDMFKFVAKGERYEEVFDFVPSLTPRMVSKSYETVTESLTKGSIPMHRVTGYFSATPPDKVIDKLVSEPLRNGLCQAEKLPKKFVLDEDVLQELVNGEIAALLVKIDGLRETLKDKGHDRLVIPYPENVSTVDELYDAFYGENGKRKRRKAKSGQGKKKRHKAKSGRGLLT